MYKGTLYLTHSGLYQGAGLRAPGPHLAGVLRLAAGVVGELGVAHVVAAQRDLEEDRGLRRRGQGPEDQLVAEGAQLNAGEAERRCGHARKEGLELKDHLPLGRRDTYMDTRTQT